MNDKVVFKSRISKKEYKSLFLPLVSAEFRSYIHFFCFITVVLFLPISLIPISVFFSFLYSVLISGFVIALLFLKNYVTYNNNLKRKPVLFEERQWTLNTSEIVLDFKSEQKKIEIDSLLKVVEKENVFFLYYNKDQCIVLPKKFIPGNQVDEVRSFLKRKIK